MDLPALRAGHCLDSQLKLSVGSGIEDVVSNPDRPIRAFLRNSHRPAR